MRPYFAYGSNMDAEQMADRCPGARPRGTACLRAHRFLINQQGYATVVPDAERLVHGVLWDIGDQDGLALDRYEGVQKGRYRRATVTVELASAEQVAALIYLAADDRPGAPREGYLERVIRGAQHHGLPGDYLKELSGWKS